LEVVEMEELAVVAAVVVEIEVFQEQIQKLVIYNQAAVVAVDQREHLMEHLMLAYQGDLVVEPVQKTLVVVVIVLL
jgi:uncharacterized phage-associated protein